MAVGVADHSGWAVLVAVAAIGGVPAVVDRRRVEVVDGDLPRQPYHAAVGLEVPAATELVRRVERSALARTTAVLEELATDLAPAHTVAALALRAEAARPIPPDVAAVLKVHSAMHAAEGELYREAFAAAAEGLGLDVVRAGRAGAGAEAAAATGVASERLEEFVAGLRRSLGPPWQADHRRATTGAIAALAGFVELRVPTARAAG